ncbi:MAG: 16S rRNA (cytosine(1402)-N(4))-methyltransferase RsmH [Parachlamydiaceae bacterium]|nr:16S rRNA (cytosine(1402)-N(4))-methyltransferase RsmH [Parachlamydiaceae bacterium]
MTQQHLSVLQREVLHYFSDSLCKIFVDGTLGAGGHSKAMLEAHPEIEKLVGIDQDPLALEIARERLKPWEDKVQLIRGNFASIKTLLNRHGIKTINGLLLDIGVSSMQLDRPEKGFSFMRDGPLDMRMDPDQPLTAAEIVNTWSERDLGVILRDYGEEKQWRALARALVEARQNFQITTTMQLSEVLMPLLGWRKGKGLHPLTLVFQALRICVNDELGVLAKILPDALDLLAPGGRLAIISFHSLEDRIVKNAFRDAASDKEDYDHGLEGLFIDKVPLVKVLTRKPAIAMEDEIMQNPRSRSAKLRVVEKLEVKGVK